MWVSPADARVIVTAMTTDDLPRDPDMDGLPRELAERTGPLTIRARDPETGETFRGADDAR